VRTAGTYAASWRNDPRGNRCPPASLVVEVIGPLQYGDVLLAGGPANTDTASSRPHPLIEDLLGRVRQQGHCGVFPPGRGRYVAEPIGSRWFMVLAGGGNPLQEPDSERSIGWPFAL